MNDAEQCQSRQISALPSSPLPPCNKFCAQKWKDNLCAGMCRKALAGLTFQLDGEDLTGADARLTQAQIERRLAIGLLARASFHGQADITSLLEVCLP
jgi:hypothetical protein